jgi:hypothetical protein
VREHGVEARGAAREQNREQNVEARARTREQNVEARARTREQDKERNVAREQNREHSARIPSISAPASGIIAHSVTSSSVKELDHGTATVAGRG